MITIVHYRLEKEKKEKKEKETTRHYMDKVIQLYQKFAFVSVGYKQIEIVILRKILFP